MKKTEIKFVYHCADLHIRLYKRHDEYREQFVKFFTSVKEHMSNNNLKREEIRIVIKRLMRILKNVNYLAMKLE